MPGCVTTHAAEFPDNRLLNLFGCMHRLANPGLIPVEIVEVQTGAYLEEDDIVRVADDFGPT